MGRLLQCLVVRIVKDFPLHPAYKLRAEDSEIARFVLGFFNKIVRHEQY